MIHDALMAAVPDPVRIFGVPLRPFAVGHWMLLSRYENKFVSADPFDAFLPDLLQGIGVCSRKYDDAVAFFSDRQAERELAKAGAKLTLDEFAAKAALFLGYITTALAMPNYWSQDGQRVELGSHWAEHIIAYLTGEMSLTLFEALNMPLKMARRLMLSHLEIRSSKKLLYDEESDGGRQRAAQEFADAVKRGEIKLNGLN